MAVRASRPRPAKKPAPAPRASASLQRKAVAESVRVLEKLYAHAPPKALQAVAGGGSLATLTEAMSAAAVASPDTDHLDAARVRGVARRETLLVRAGGVLTPQAVVARTGMSRQTVNNWRRNGQLIALPRGRRDFVFPACQFLEDRPVPGLDRVLAASALRHPLSRLEMLLTPSRRMDGTSPLDLLRAHRVEDAVTVAAATGSPLDAEAPATRA